jgi:hypothetical protein
MQRSCAVARRAIESAEPALKSLLTHDRAAHRAPAAYGSKRRVGYDVERREDVYAVVQEAFGPGQKLSLRQSEFERLKDLVLFATRPISSRCRHLKTKK